MPDRTINWGDPSDPGTTYQTGDDDPAGGGNFVVARDTDGGVTLLEYDAVNSEWVSRGDVNLDGNDLSANAINAASVSAETLEATTSITDPNGNTVTSLSDAVRVTEDAVTFTESDITVTTTNAVVDNGSVRLLNQDITQNDTTQQARANAIDSGVVVSDGDSVIVFVDDNENLKYYNVTAGSVTDTGEQSDYQIAVGDVDGDGVDEIAFVDTNQNIKYRDVDDAQTTDIQEQGARVAVGDVTGDGQDDIVFQDPNQNIKYYEVATGSTTNPSISGIRLRTGDVTGDGQADIIYVGGGALDEIAYYNVAAGTETLTGNNTFLTPVAGDVTGNGQSDIVFEDTNDNIKYYDVATDTTIDIGNDGDNVAVGDVTGNGQADIVYNDPADVIQLYNVATDTVTEIGGNGQLGIKVGDVTGDGQADIVHVNNVGGSTGDLKYIEVTPDATSGNALVTFDSSAPEDIETWDLATFQRTLDSETVTIDVEDSNGTVLKSDISRNQDISDIAISTDVRLRATLSRSDVANNPTLDYAARRFTR